MSEKNYNSNNIRGKLKVCKYLNGKKDLKPYVPHTVSFNKTNLNKMTKNYSSLYIKPDVGSQGIGIYKVNREFYGFELKSTQKGQKSRYFNSESELFKHISAKVKKKMIIQKGIDLDHVNGRPYDIRAMVQRKPRESWVCTGFLVKVGASNRIVTNYFQGGEIYTIQRLLKEKEYPSWKRKSRIQKLKNIAVKVSRRLSVKRSGMHEMGIDFAYSKNQKLWILEVNSNHPEYHPLRKLDTAAYNRIRSFAKSYGRAK